jgi:hypothetical protein
MTTDLPQTQKLGRSARLAVTGKLKVALDAMVWRGLRYAEAGKVAGITARGMRVALEKPLVCAYLAAGKRALRSSEGPRNVLRLTQLRDQDRNMVARSTPSKCSSRSPKITPSTAARPLRSPGS